MKNYNVSGISDVSRCNLDASKLESLNWKEITIVELLCIPSTMVKIEDINEVSLDINIDCIKLIETPYSKKNYVVALLDDSGNIVYEDGKVKSCTCCKAFTLESNEEGTCISGRKLLVNGLLKQKIIYTGDNFSQSVHMFKHEYPFSTYIIVYAKFKDISALTTDIVVIDPLDNTKTIIIDGYLYNNNNPVEVNLCEDFCVDVFVEDIFTKLVNSETIFKSISLFLSAKPSITTNLLP
ncbi:MAG: hypothetical protein ACRC3Y_15675 [Romboutsia sp.]|uniref:hypothetical protein n=1 Tax=Romboutsia sp. TaxID=1965302 RepID=UPI003F377612